MTSFFVDFLQPLRLNTTEPLCEMRAFAPFVWQTTYGFEMLLSAAPRDDGPASLFHGVSSDGVYFALDRYPVIATEGHGREGYQDACVIRDQGRYIVYYGVANSTRTQSSIGVAASRGDNRSRICPSI